MDNTTLIEFVKESLKSENLEGLQVDLSGNSGKTDGYLGEITFTKVTGRDRTSGESKVINLVIKSSRIENKEMMPFIKQMFEQEVEVYTKIFPSMLQFQLEKNAKSLFVDYPKCYNAVTNDDFQAISFENLKSAGYELHDRKVPLDIHHVKILLEAYAKCHATSLAFYSQRKEEYQKIHSRLLKFSTQRFALTAENIDGFPKVVNKFFDGLLKMLKDRKKLALYDQLKSFLEKDWNKELVDRLDEDTGFSVISHCDAWSNNYLFKYGERASNTPIDVKILDWQMVDTLNSPVHDISHFLYNCASVELLNNLTHLLRHYHDHLSKYLSELNCGPEFFPFSLLEQHWRKFNLFGFVHVPYVIKQCHWDAEDLPSDMFSGDWSEWSNKIVVKDENYYERLFGVVEHYLNYKL